MATRLAGNSPRALVGLAGLIAACGSSPVEDKPAPPPPADAAPVDAYVKLTGFATAEEAANAFLAAAENHDEPGMRATLVDLPANEHYYDCSSRKDYNLPATTEKGMMEAVIKGRTAWREYQKHPKAKLVRLGFTETKRMPRSVGEISGVCRVRIPLDVVLGRVDIELVEGKQHTKYTASFILVFADNVYRVNTVTWI